MDELSLLIDLHLAGRRQAPGGDGETDLAIKLAVSELTWLTAERPAELEDYWQQAYSEVDTAGAKIARLFVQAKRQ